MKRKKTAVLSLTGETVEVIKPVRINGKTKIRVRTVEGWIRHFESILLDFNDSVSLSDSKSKNTSGV